MSIFGKILDKLGPHKDKDQPSASTHAQAQGTPAQHRGPAAAPTQTAPHTAAPGAQRTSPPLLGMESSLAERKELAAELGYPRNQMDDSAKMNVWLHKQVLRRIAENGGSVPKELLD
jgi:hypothetical protein